MPNRATFMTGRYPTTHGLRYNGCLLSERANTFVDVLAASGTACRAKAGACDVAEMCDGSSVACPEDGVVDAPSSLVVEQAANRLHVQRALFREVLGV